MKSSFYILTLWCLLALSCDPCDECGEPLIYEPTVELKLINQDSLNDLSDSLSKNREAAAIVDSDESYYENEIDILEDSVLTLNQLIEDGETNLDDELESVEFKIDSLGGILESVEIESDRLDSLRNKINDVIKVINSGSVLVNELTILENNSTITYTDSVKRYYLPLLMDRNNTSYRMRIRDEQFILSLSYQLEEDLNNARVFRVIATDILVDENYSFDELSVTCNSDNCKSNETAITAYF